MPPRHPRGFPKNPRPLTQSLPAPSKGPPFSSPFPTKHISQPTPAAVLPDGNGTDEAQAQGSSSAGSSSASSSVANVGEHYRQILDRSFPIESGGCEAQSILVNSITHPSGLCGNLARKMGEKGEGEEFPSGKLLNQSFGRETPKGGAFPARRNWWKPKVWKRKVCWCRWPETRCPW